MLLLIYLVLGYWAVGQTIYKNKILIGSGTSIFMTKFAWALFAGMILIPIAVIKCVLKIIMER